MAKIRKRILPSGKAAWQCDYTDQRGQRRSKQFKTKTEADAFLVAARHEVSTGTHAPAAAEKMTVETVARDWLASCEVRMQTGRKMERASYEDYRSKVETHILCPEVGIGHIKLARLSARDVRLFRDRLMTVARKTSPRKKATAIPQSDANTRKILSILYAVLKHAKADGLISINPADGIEVEATSRVRKRITPPTKAEVKSLMDAASDAFKPLLVVSAMCGLRASESRGLRWSDVDLESAVLHVRQRLDRYGKEGDPKSDAGHREVPMGPFVVNTLKRWQDECPKGDMGLVFPGPRGGPRNHANTLNRDFYPLLTKLGLNLRWHDLRHFAVSLWIEQGFNVKAVQTFAGHSAIQMTMDRYGHLFPSADHQKGMAEIEERMFA